ncbi:hypothetical protein ACF3NR_02595 [Vaginella massiliensis]|uniref:hypothetical protein n=1 Tax=Vaginella massiliensis TaxID=1816680 RepID=UPI0008387EC8|nr:hypothetical protein [Vaginella massiliensis]
MSKIVKKYLAFLFLFVALVVATGQTVHILDHVHQKQSVEQNELNKHQTHCDLCYLVAQTISSAGDDLVVIPAMISSRWMKIEKPYIFFSSNSYHHYNNLRAPPFVS